MKQPVIIIFFGFILSGCIEQEPYAEFDLYEAAIPANQDLDIYNNSRNSDSYLWDFGDGNFSTIDNPTHFYSNPGEYTIKLTAYNKDQSKSDDYIEKVFIQKLTGIELTSYTINSFPSQGPNNESWSSFSYVQLRVLDSSGVALSNTNIWTNKSLAPQSIYVYPSGFDTGNLNVKKGTYKIQLFASTSSLSNPTKMAELDVILNDSLINGNNYLNLQDGDFELELYLNKTYELPKTSFSIKSIP